MKAARQLSGLSQMQLGIRAGIDASSASARINQYERGKHVPDFLTVCNLAKVLCVPSAYFYAEEDALAELISLFGQMKTQERKTLLGLVESLVKESAASKTK
jgi:transcriptional regulator with XRE-family HTH domain